MATAQGVGTDWVRRLRAGAGTRVSEVEKQRRRAETARVLTFRNGLRSIAPETTGSYIDEIRSEHDRG